MMPFLETHLGLLGVVAILVTIGIISIILMALCRKDHVRAGVRLRSFSFFLEAHDANDGRRSRKSRTLQQ